MIDRCDFEVKSGVCSNWITGLFNHNQKKICHLRTASWSHSKDKLQFVTKICIRYRHISAVGLDTKIHAILSSGDVVPQ